ncbi:MAG: septal ring lytic transglycosylase RlpA family protein, partial [Alphaproteobacteria bacterium]|nr:septal ring lytic transglycosylase RlpA family protein [Alphaproteobacteria bacterium]
MKKLVSLTALVAVLAGCATGNDAKIYGSESLAEEDLTAGTVLNDSYLMAAAPKYYIGNAYKVDDVQYIPSEDLTYNQTGIAGIIPTELSGQKTTNGEVFDASQMVATSKTLPLPTIAKVTNLDNGESVVVRVNNRGPFVNTRIMDLSPAAAEKIGLNSQAKVQVQVLTEQSIAVKNATIGAPEPETTVQPASVAEPQPAAQPQPVATSGEYAIQLAAFYAQDSADAMAARMKAYGDAVVVNEGGMYKVRIVNLDATKARSVINALRTNEGMAPGLLKDGRWV